MVEVFEITDRAEWLKWRAGDLTASDIGAAAGVDRHKSPLALYSEKIGLLMPPGDTPLMRRGRWLEMAVMSAIEEENPSWVLKKATSYYRDADLRLAATPDFIAITDEPGITNIQAKVVSAPAYEANWSDGPPLAYQLQTLTEGMLMNAARSYVAALVISTYSAELHLHRVDRHQAAEDAVVGIAKAFWRCVDNGTPPPANYAQDAELIAALHPPDKTVAEPLDLTADNHLAVLLPELAALKSGMSSDRKRVEEIEAEIKAKLGDHETALLPGWRLTWKPQKRKAVTMPEAHFRVLRVTDLTEKDEAA